MKNRCRLLGGLAAAVATVALVVSPVLGAAETDPGRVDFGSFAPSEGGGEFVEVQIKGNLINMVARVAKGSEPEVAEVLSGLRFIRVNVLGLNEDNRAGLQDRIRSLRRTLDQGGWDRVATVQEKDGQDVGVYIKLRGEEAVEGIVVTVVDNDKEAVLVNIAGDLRPEQLALVGERFNIEPLKHLGVAKRS